MDLVCSNVDQIKHLTLLQLVMTSMNVLAANATVSPQTVKTLRVASSALAAQGSHQAWIADPLVI